MFCRCVTFFLPGRFCQITKSCKSYLSSTNHGQGKCYSYGQGGARAKARAKARARARARATAMARAYIQRDFEQRDFMRTGTISDADWATTRKLYFQIEYG